MKHTFLIAIIIIINSSCGNNSYNKKQHSNTDTLFTSHFNEYIGVAGDRRDELKELIHEFYSEKKNETTLKLIKFMVSNRRYGTMVLPVLIQNRDSLFRAWYQKEGVQLGDNYDIWQALNWNRFTVTDREKNFEYNSSILDILIGFLENKNDTVFWNNTLNLANDIGTHKQVENILKIPKKYSDKDVFITLQTRYKDNISDSIINNELRKQQKFSFMEYFIEFGLQTYNRYDYLSFLYNYKEQLQKETDIRLEDDIKSLLKLTNETIMLLEKAKQENAPIGLPLDWPK
jgi:hypothetical protein